MNKPLTVFYLLFSLTFNSFSQKNNVDQLNQLNAKLNRNQISFTENKGQVHNQQQQPRPDVLFGGQSNGLVFHLRNKGISYQLNRIDKWKETQAKYNTPAGRNSKNKAIDQSTIYRVDINWLNANDDAKVLSENELAGVNHYYMASGEFSVKSFGQVTYQNLYKGIDLKWYEKEGELKYDYLCAAGSNYQNIQLQIEGADQLSINSKGELEIATPLGTIIEKAPLVLQEGKQLTSKWILTANILSFKIENLNTHLPYVIDPAVRVWGTYYGGNSFDYANACATYTNGDVYMVGSTYLNTSTIIATTGSHQSTLGGMDDAFLVKFNSSGVRLWSTYYGGSDSDNGRSCTVDASGNVYVCGITSSNNGIATGAAHQTVIGGGSFPDAFLVKFNSSGVRQWGTYYGGNSVDEAHQCALDPSGNIYMSGTTELATSTVIATAGVHQSTFGGGVNDAFLVKFDANGVRQWGTYYGGSNIDFGGACSVDANHVYMASSTSSTNSALFSAGHQSTYGGSLYDAYIVKFNNSNGTRIWGSYYGGSGIDQAYGCSVDALGNVYMCGVSNSSLTNVIATSGAHQSSGATTGDDEAFLVKFDNNGVRLWGTYYGGDTFDKAFGCSVDASNNIYLVGTTSSTLSSAIATSASHQTVIGSSFGTNAFLAKFNSSGVRQWGTYYGEDGEDGTGCSINASGEIYMCGLATSTTSSFISTSGSHQASYGGIADAFLVKFSECSATAPTSATSASNQVICSGNTSTLSASGGTATINWYATATSTSVIGTGTNYITATLSPGTYTFYAEGATCGSPLRTAISLTVHPTPTITANSGSICAGESFTIVPSGAITYTVLNSSFVPQPGLVITPIITASYVVAGTSSNGCVSQLANLALINVTVNASPTVGVNNGSICVGQSFVIQPTGANSYTIQGGTATVSPVSTGQYTITGSAANGCVSANSATSTVTVDATPTISVSNGSLCAGKTFTINASGVATYTVQGGSAVVSPTANTSYTVIGKSPAGCLSQNVATCNITVLSTPTITAANATVCAGKAYTIMPAGAVTYSLLDAGGNPYTSNMVVSPLTHTTYFVAGTGANGCINQLNGLAFVSITASAPTITVNNGAICSGNAFTIVPSGALTYTFQNGSAVVSPSVSANYTVVGTDAEGCVGITSASITVEVAPVVAVKNGTVCSGNAFTIVPSGAATYTVQGGSLVVSPKVNTTYTVIGASSAGCLSGNTATASVNIEPYPHLWGWGSDTLTAVQNYDFLYARYNDNISFDAYTDIPCRFSIEPSLKREFLHLDPYHTEVSYYGQTHENITYTLTAKSSFGCSTSSEIKVIYVSLLEQSQKSLPNFISPNGDGQNDTWGGTIFFYENQLSIFNQNYKLVYSSKTENLWKGKDNNGNDLPAGIYYYWYSFKDTSGEAVRIGLMKKEVEFLTGFIELKR